MPGYAMSSCGTPAAVSAPSIARRTGLEWAWRMLREPRRLGPRYVKCMGVVLRLVARTIPQIVKARMRKAA